MSVFFHYWIWNWIWEANENVHLLKKFNKAVFYHREHFKSQELAQIFGNVCKEETRQEYKLSDDQGLEKSHVVTGN